MLTLAKAPFSLPGLVADLAGRDRLGGERLTEGLVAQPLEGGGQFEVDEIGDGGAQGLAAADNGRHRVVELVGDTGHQLAQHRHLLALHQLGMSRFEGVEGLLQPHLGADAVLQATVEMAQQQVGKGGEQLAARLHDAGELQLVELDHLGAGQGHSGGKGGFTGDERHAPHQRAGAVVHHLLIDPVGVALAQHHLPLGDKPEEAVGLPLAGQHMARAVVAADPRLVVAFEKLVEAVDHHPRQLLVAATGVIHKALTILGQLAIDVGPQQSLVVEHGRIAQQIRLRAVQHELARLLDDGAAQAAVAPGALQVVVEAAKVDRLDDRFHLGLAAQQDLAARLVTAAEADQKVGPAAIPQIAVAHHHGRRLPLALQLLKRQLGRLLPGGDHQRKAAEQRGQLLFELGQQLDIGGDTQQGERAHQRHSVEAQSRLYQRIHQGFARGLTAAKESKRIIKSIIFRTKFDKSVNNKTLITM